MFGFGSRRKYNTLCVKNTPNGIEAIVKDDGNYFWERRSQGSKTWSSRQCITEAEAMEKIKKLKKYYR